MFVKGIKDYIRVVVTRDMDSLDYMRRREMPERIQSDDMNGNTGVINDNAHSSINVSQVAGESSQIIYNHYEININIPESFDKEQLRDVFESLRDSIPENNRPLKDGEHFNVQKKYRFFGR